MDERKKVRVTINQNSKDHRSHDLEQVLTPKNRGIHKFSNRKKFSVTILRAVLLAVALGTLFGFAMMYFFDLSTEQTPVNAPVETIADQDEDEDQEVDESGNEGNGNAVYQLELNSHHVFQLGVFSTEENARELQNELSSIPSVVTENEGQFVLVSSLITDSTVESEVANYFESIGLEENEGYIVKPWTFSNVESEVPDDVRDWLAQGEQLISVESLNDEWINETEDWLSQLPGHYSDDVYLDEAINIVTAPESEDGAIQVQRQTLILAIYLFFDSI
ncbi:hypothetical protein [Alkalibacillus silvisoli]|uniref:SPOR domain-containing protein n=1 Tax=Alkalibacillus silvisoli TaxID=392823 RepID=A0ABP3JKK6_9BACI